MCSAYDDLAACLSVGDEVDACGAGGDCQKLMLRVFCGSGICQTLVNAVLLRICLVDDRKKIIDIAVGKVSLHQDS